VLDYKVTPGFQDEELGKNSHHTIQINQPTRCNSFTSLLLDVYVWLNMFQAPLRPSSGVYNCTRSLWFYRWSVAVGATNNAPTVKPDVPNADVRS